MLFMGATLVMIVGELLMWWTDAPLGTGVLTIIQRLAAFPAVNRRISTISSDTSSYPLKLLVRKLPHLSNRPKTPAFSTMPLLLPTAESCYTPLVTIWSLAGTLLAFLGVQTPLCCSHILPAAGNHYSLWFICTRSCIVVVLVHTTPCCSRFSAL